MFDVAAGDANINGRTSTVAFGICPAGQARVIDGQLVLKGLVASPDRVPSTSCPLAEAAPILYDLNTSY